MDIPDDVMREAERVYYYCRMSMNPEHIARAILAERKRCADWCDKTAWLGYAKDRILSGEQP